MKMDAFKYNKHTFSYYSINCDFFPFMFCEAKHFLVISCENNNI